MRCNDSAFEPGFRTEKPAIGTRVLVVQAGFAGFEEERAMRVGRIAMMVLLAALIAAPVAYAQLSGVLDGAELLMAAFGPGETEMASIAR